MTACSGSVQVASLGSLAGLLRVCGRVIADEGWAVSVSMAAEVGGFTSATVPAGDADPVAVMGQASRVARATGRSQLVWAPDGSGLAVTCWQAGWSRHSSLAVMTADLRTRGSGQRFEGVVPVVDAESAALFRQVHLERGRAAEVVDFFGRDEVVLGSQTSAVVSVERGRTVAAGYLFDGGAGVGGLYWIATVDAHQGRGHGARVTEALVAQAHGRGLHQLVLQATRAGRGVYQRAGFEDAGLVTRWCTPAIEAGVPGSRA